VFLEQLIGHLIIPLAPFLLSLRNQGFVCDKFQNFIFNLFFPCLVYVALITYFLSDTTDVEIVSGAFVIPILFFIQHRLTVALKYASLSPSEYRKFYYASSVTQANHYTDQMQLLNQWTSRNEPLIEFELGCTAVRLATRINEIFFILHDPTIGPSELNEMIHWNAFMTGLYSIQNGFASAKPDSFPGEKIGPRLLPLFRIQRVRMKEMILVGPMYLKNNQMVDIY
jgi:hypothetical protein